jgi:ketosteroid isomerase-like protein
MSQENVETVRRAITAINARDIDAYLACCTENVELRTPLEAFGDAYEGREGIKRWLADIEDAAPDFQIELDGLKAIGGNRVLAFLRTSSSGRASGISLGFEATNVYDFIDGKIRRIRLFLSRDEALKAAGLQQ